MWVRHLVPWSAGEDVAVAWAKASRSRRTEEDCLRAELNREFYKFGIREAKAVKKICTNHCKKEGRVLAAFSKSMWPASND